MTAQRAWKWHLHEMREATRMNDSLPKVAGFIPINHPESSDPAPINTEYENAAIKTTAADKPRASKRRKPQPSAATTAIKPKKAASMRNTKRVKTAAQLDCQDISQALSRTKPMSSGCGALPTKSKLSLEDISLEQDSELQGSGDTSVGFEIKPAPPRLTDTYQAAFPTSWGKAIDHATPPTPPKSDEVEADLCHHSCDQDSVPERHLSPDMNVEVPLQQNPEFDSSVIIRDFGAPPFTQTSPPNFQGPSFPEKMMVDDFEPLDSIPDYPFEVGNIENGDKGGEDEFPVDDESFEEMIESMAFQAEEEPLGSDWPPRELSDDTLYDEQPKNDQSHWSEAIPYSDREVIYDEGPSLVVSDLIDVPSSPSRSSQASCILTHITGNAAPCRARTAEGYENCFDDQDLDDSLIDLTVDESQSLQVTYPVTPARPPSSPKLKWLPPKTYTPAKSSQTPKPPIDIPHLVSVNTNRDTLPFIRPPFPKAIRDRSPILGLSNRTVLRTCFRIGEALNAAAVASRTNVDAIIELYARVVTSSREASGGYKQFFQFGDLFTDKPPYLNGVHTFWKGVELWDVDSRKLVDDEGRGKMVRVLGKIKRTEAAQGQGSGVEMAVLSIWEVDWEDVGIAKGIVCA